MVLAMSLKVAIKKSHVDRNSNFTLDVDFLAKNGVTVLFGASGSGKTTVLDCIGGLIKADSGTVELNDQVLFDSNKRVNLSPATRRLGYVFQSPTLFPHMTVLNNVRFGIANEIDAVASELLERFHIAHLAQQYPSRLSGGEKQRVALARTIATQPRALLLDEPLSGLDDETKFALIDDLRGWNEEVKIPVIYVTHALEEVFELGEKVVVLEAGKIVKQGIPREVLKEEKDRLIAALA